LSYWAFNLGNDQSGFRTFVIWIFSKIYTNVVELSLFLFKIKIMIANLSQDDFDIKVLNADKPVILELWGLRCSFCEKLDPIFKQAAKDADESADFYQMLVNDNIELARKLKVMGVPMILFYQHGVLVAKMKGLQSGVKILKQLDRIKNYSPEEAKKNEYRPLLKRIFGKK